MGLCLVLAYVSTRSTIVQSCSHYHGLFVGIWNTVLWRILRLCSGSLRMCKDQIMIASDAGETHDGIRLWICYSWHVHIWKILSKDPKMQRFKALSFLALSSSRPVDGWSSSSPSSFRQRQNISRKGFCLCTLVPNLGAQLYFERE